MTTTVGTVVALDDILTEDTDGQYVEVDLTDAEGTPIDTASLVGLAGTLRASDTGTAVFEDADLLAAPARASYPGEPGRVRVTFTAADLESHGPRALQTRVLTLAITHSTDQLFHCAVQFTLQNLGDV
jgi:hypothetical protein